MMGEGRHFRMPRRLPDEDARVLPLINIVFLLLVFFMIAGHMSATGPFEIDPVQSASTGLPQPENLTLYMAADGRLALDGVELDIEELEAAVRARHAADAGLRVRLQADGRTEAMQVVFVMERLRAAGTERLELLTLPER
jgi:biopolymer transport protein TolR